MILKEQIKAQDYSEEEEKYLSKLVLLLGGDSRRMNNLDNQSPPLDRRKRAEINAFARRLLGHVPWEDFDKKTELYASATVQLLWEGWLNGGRGGGKKRRKKRKKMEEEKGDEVEAVEEEEEMYRTMQQAVSAWVAIGDGHASIGGGKKRLREAMTQNPHKP
ncbi:hypothetical protein B296_00029509 [Ensete ventricosum]|uniref:Uncharacterized protein n=1 Tax=Ensete ventricosum TaxID=4639 RepID=A0A427AKX1_ENSVE|nr:hypothetical protein B296_00029509 [Ensete ventricosum]